MRDAEGIAVVIPTKNRATAVESKVRGLLQRYGDITQLIVVVDGATDDTYEQLSRISDSRLSVIVNQPSQGTPAAKNRGLALVMAPWVATLDDDDEHSEGYLECLREVARAEGADVVCAPWLNVPQGVDPGVVFQRSGRSMSGAVPGQPHLVPARRFAESIWGPSNFLFSSAVLAAGVKFDPGYRYNFWREETDFLVSAARAGFRVGITNAAYSYVTKRTAGGISKRALGYEVWTILNDLRFIRKHGRWLKRNGAIQSLAGFIVKNAAGRARARTAPLLLRLRPSAGTPR